MGPCLCGRAMRGNEVNLRHLLARLHVEPQPIHVLHYGEAAGLERQVQQGTLSVCLTAKQVYVGLHDTQLAADAPANIIRFTGYCRLFQKEYACQGEVDRTTLCGTLQLQTSEDAA